MPDRSPRPPPPGNRCKITYQPPRSAALGSGRASPRKEDEEPKDDEQHKEREEESEPEEKPKKLTRPRVKKPKAEGEPKDPKEPKAKREKKTKDVKGTTLDGVGTSLDTEQFEEE
jgi:hypothetical protein